MSPFSSKMTGLDAPTYPQPLRSVFPNNYNVFFALLVVVIVALVYFAIERGIRSPWGRVLKAIREDEGVAQAVGKDVFKFKLQALVVGAFIMGIGGSLFAHFTAYISPEAFEPMNGTFLVWAMLIVGGSGNSRGAILGALVIWAIWSGTDIAAASLPAALGPRVHALRVMLIGLLLMVTLVLRPQGILGEERHVSRMLKRRDGMASKAADG